MKKYLLLVCDWKDFPGRRKIIVVMSIKGYSFCGLYVVCGYDLLYFFVFKT